MAISSEARKAQILDACKEFASQLARELCQNGSKNAMDEVDVWKANATIEETLIIALAFDYDLGLEAGSVAETVENEVRRLVSEQIRREN